ncbi:MAG: glycosyltransferase [Syntrophorhabdales bacterium]|jgi:GT2 family glycosyltransferase
MAIDDRTGHVLLAVLVLYKENLWQSTTFSSLFSTFPDWGKEVHLLVYDNSPVPMHSLEEFTSSCRRIRYISDTSNPGVSSAYNKGFEIARQLRKEWLLLLDQDTAFPRDALRKYFTAIKAHDDSVLFAPVLANGGKIYSPCGHILNVNFPLRRIRRGKVSTGGKSLLNSGMCVRLDAFDRVGGFDEAIPLDFADHDFMKRYRQHFDSFFLLDMVCAHNFSDKERTDIDKAFARFAFFCKGAKNSAKGVLDAFSLLPLALLRATRLTLRFRSPAFLYLFLRTFFRN